jgi:hypothetical protein
MIPAPPGLVARFRHVRSEDGSEYDYPRAIVAFDDEGSPYVIPDDGERLVPAQSYSNYVGFGKAPESPIVSLIPAGGWRMERADAEDDEPYSAPLVGWALLADGRVVPLDTDRIGEVGEASGRIYHPDEEHQLAETEHDPS